MNIQNDTPATALRRRMTEDMQGRNLGPHSQRNYLNNCARFAAFLGRSPHCTTVVAEGGERWSSGGLFFAKRSVPWSSKPSPPSAEHCTPMSL